MKRFTLVGLTPLLLFVSCQDPQTVYFKQIEKNGFIPFKQPMGNVRTGSILRGKPNQLFPMAPPTSCFPDKINGEPTELRWESDTDLPKTHYSAQLDFNAKLNTIAQAGTPSITFKFEMTKITKVDFEAKNVTVEMFDQFVLQDFYENAMSKRCKDELMKHPFVLDALQAKEMSFVFLDVFGGKIQLTSNNLQQIVDIAIDVKWHIENGYKLVVTSPKFIGYHLGRLRAVDEGMVNLISVQVDKKANSFIWIDLNVP